MPLAARLQRLLPGLWAGLLLTLALVATPSLFALLPPAEAGRLAGRMLAQEAYASLVLGALVLVLERREAKRQSEAGQGSQFSTGMALAAGAIFCTVAGYFALLPLMAAARGGGSALSFGQLHGVSLAFFAFKTLLVLALAWRAAFRPTS